MKKIAKLLFVFMLLISITACGSKEAADTNTTSGVMEDVVEETSSETVQEVVEDEVEIEEFFESSEIEKEEILAEEKYLLTEKNHYKGENNFWSGERYEYNESGTLIKTIGIDNDVMVVLVKKMEQHYLVRCVKHENV